MVLEIDKEDLRQDNDLEKTCTAIASRLQEVNENNTE